MARGRLGNKPTWRLSTFAARQSVHPAWESLSGRHPAEELALGSLDLTCRILLFWTGHERVPRFTSCSERRHRAARPPQVHVSAHRDYHPPVQPRPPDPHAKKQGTRGRGRPLRGATAH